MLISKSLLMLSYLFYFYHNHICSLKEQPHNEEHRNNILFKEHRNSSLGNKQKWMGSLVRIFFCRFEYWFFLFLFFLFLFFFIIWQFCDKFFFSEKYGKNRLFYGNWTSDHDFVCFPYMQTGEVAAYMEIGRAAASTRSSGPTACSRSSVPAAA